MQKNVMILSGAGLSAASGVANKMSIAYSIPKACKDQGADLAFTFLNDIVVIINPIIPPTSTTLIGYVPINLPSFVVYFFWTYEI